MTATKWDRLKKQNKNKNGNRFILIHGKKWNRTEKAKVKERKGQYEFGNLIKGQKTILPCIKEGIIIRDYNV